MSESAHEPRIDTGSALDLLALIVERRGWALRLDAVQTPFSKLVLTRLTVIEPHPELRRQPGGRRQALKQGELLAAVALELGGGLEPAAEMAIDVLVRTGRVEA